jgi:hypothetical protein
LAIDLHLGKIWLSSTSNYAATPSAGPFLAAKAWALRFFSGAE